MDHGVTAKACSSHGKRLEQMADNRSGGGALLQFPLNRGTTGARNLPRSRTGARLARRMTNTFNTGGEG